MKRVPMGLESWFRFLPPPPRPEEAVFCYFCFVFWIVTFFFGSVGRRGLNDLNEVLMKLIYIYLGV